MRSDLRTRGSSNLCSIRGQTPVVAAPLGPATRCRPDERGRRSTQSPESAQWRPAFLSNGGFSIVNAGRILTPLCWASSDHRGLRGPLPSHHHRQVDGGCLDDHRHRPGGHNHRIRGCLLRQLGPRVLDRGDGGGCQRRPGPPPRAYRGAAGQRGFAASAVGQRRRTRSGLTRSSGARLTREVGPFGSVQWVFGSIP